MFLLLFNKRFLTILWNQFQLVLEDNEEFHHHGKLGHVNGNPLDEPGGSAATADSSDTAAKRTFEVRVTSGSANKSSQKSWHVRRSLEDFRFLDRQLHLCVYDRRFSNLAEIPDQENLHSNSGMSNKVGQKLHISHAIGVAFPYSRAACSDALYWSRSALSVT